MSFVAIQSWTSDGLIHTAFLYTDLEQPLDQPFWPGQNVFLLMFTLENCKRLSPKIQPQVGGLQLADIKSIQVISKLYPSASKCYVMICDWAGRTPSFCRNVQDVFLQLYMISFALRKGWRLAAGRLVDRFGVGRKTVQSLEIPNWSSQHGCFLF